MHFLQVYSLNKYLRYGIVYSCGIMKVRKKADRECCLCMCDEMRKKSKLSFSATIEKSGRKYYIHVSQEEKIAQKL